MADVESHPLTINSSRSLRDMSISLAFFCQVEYPVTEVERGEDDGEDDSGNDVDPLGSQGKLPGQEAALTGAAGQDK